MAQMSLRQQTVTISTLHNYYINLNFNLYSIELDQTNNQQFYDLCTLQRILASTLELRAVLPVCPFWRQLTHSDYGENVRVLLHGVTTSSPYHSTKIKQWSNNHNWARTHLTLITANVCKLLYIGQFEYVLFAMSQFPPTMKSYVPKTQKIT